MSCSCKNGGNMFFYTRKVKSDHPEGDDTLVVDSFNVSKVIRTIEMDNGDYLVLLDDLHSRKENVPVRNKKGEITSYKNETNTFQSELTLLKSTGDTERFKQLTEIQ